MQLLALPMVLPGNDASCLANNCRLQAGLTLIASSDVDAITSPQGPVLSPAYCPGEYVPDYGLHLLVLQDIPGLQEAVNGGRAAKQESQKILKRACEALCIAGGPLCYATWGCGGPGQPGNWQVDDQHCPLGVHNERLHATQHGQDTC